MPWDGWDAWGLPLLSSVVPRPLLTKRQLKRIFDLADGSGNSGKKGLQQQQPQCTQPCPALPASLPHPLPSSTAAA